MIKRLGFASVLAIFFILAIATTFGGNGLTGNQAWADNSADKLRQEVIRDFNKWREEIPDYEKRLFDRVKQINKRLIQRTNIIFILLVVIIIAMPFLVRRFLPPNGSANSRQPFDMASETSRRSQADERQLARLEENQLILNDMLTNIGNEYERYKQRAEDFEREGENIEGLMKECANHLKELDANLARLKSKDENEEPD